MFYVQIWYDYTEIWDMYVYMDESTGSQNIKVISYRNTILLFETNNELKPYFYLEKCLPPLFFLP